MAWFPPAAARFDPESDGGGAHGLRRTGKEKADDFGNGSRRLPATRAPPSWSAPKRATATGSPLPSTGHITAKITPYTAPYDDFASGIQVLEPGAAIREHGHQRAHELIFVYQGTGHAIIDGERYELRPETLIVVGRRVLHYLENEGDDQMRMLWVIFPPGLEDWFRAIGRPRTPGDGPPPVFDRPDNVKDIQDRQKFLRPEDAVS